MPYLRQTSLADSPAACSFKTLMICSSVNLLLRMSVSRRNGLYPKLGAFKGSRSVATYDFTRRNKWDFNLSSIDADYPTTASMGFDKTYMRQLYHYGYDQGYKGQP